jgi:DNA-binding CsgD family transcriptional regulator
MWHGVKAGFSIRDSPDAWGFPAGGHWPRAPVIARRGSPGSDIVWRPVSRDFVDIIEAAYAPTVSEQDWLQAIADAALPCLERGMGVNAYTYDAAAVPFQVPCGVSAGPAFIDHEGIVSICRSASAETIRYFYRPGAPAWFSQLALGLPAELRDQLGAQIAARGIADVLGILGGDPNLRGCIITVGSPVRGRLEPRLRKLLSRVGAHLAAAYRLRHEGQSVDAADAVLTPAGRLVHADSEHVVRERRVLADFMRRRNLARGRLRRESEDEAVAAWDALVRGEWTLVDHTDVDGKRFVLARRNQPAVGDPGGMTLRERQVATYAALGHSNKHICYELGLGPAVVSRHLRQALRKLRLRDRAELVALLGPKPPPHVVAERGP